MNLCVTTSECPHCAQWAEELTALRQRVAELERQLAAALKNSGNSSKPPSSDFTKPPQPQPKKGKRKRGAQPGHPRHERQAFTQEEIDQAFNYYYDRCPDCNGPMTYEEQPTRVFQQVELDPRPITVSEHRGLGCWCAACQKLHPAPIDPVVLRAGLAGPRLTALVAFLKGVCHCSFSTIRKFLRDVVQVQVSRGYLRKLCAKVADGLQVSYEHLLGLLPGEAVLNVDETGHKDNGQGMWTWCFRASLYTLFKISPSRSSDVLLEVLGEEFQGLLGCDYFSAYRKYMRLNENVLLQFCLAHFIRDVKFLVTHPNSKNRAYGRRVLEATRQLFHVFHRRDEMTPAEFAGQLEDAGFEVWTQATFRVPATREAQNLAQRFHQHGPSYVRFITTPGIEPTNNLAEQAIRFVVIDRKVTQGSRSEGGQRWLERIWTAIATCSQQGRSVFDFLYETVTAIFHQTEPPLLIAPDSS